jgi:hypothetical protein
VRVKPDGLLRDVPDLDDWAAAAGTALTQENWTELLAAYYENYAVELPAFDDDGWPLLPPDEHILDAFAREWIPELSVVEDMRAEFGTVAVVSELIPCDLCGWGAARYESPVGLQRILASLCLCCFVQRGDSQLGSGHATLMMQRGQIPSTARAVIERHLAARHRASWRISVEGDGWDGYRRWGFTGPDDSGRLYAFIANVQLSVELGPMGSAMIVARGAGIRQMYAPGGDQHFVPRSEDWLDVRAILFRVLRSEFVTGRGLEARDRYFWLDAGTRDERAMDALTSRGGGSQWLKLGDHLAAESGDYQVAREAASESTNARVLARLARDHPWFVVRMDAIANPAMDTGDLFTCAEARDAAVAHALLERTDLPSDATALVVETLLLQGTLNRRSMDLALLRADFPERLLATTVERVSSEGTHARIELASLMHEAPLERRDWVHEYLLRNARKIKSSIDLVDAVVGNEPARLAWVLSRPDSRIRALARWREEQRSRSESKPQGADPSNNAASLAGSNDGAMETSRTDEGASARTGIEGANVPFYRPGSRRPRARRTRDDGVDVVPQQVLISAQSLAHMSAVDLRSISDSADYTDATRAAAVTELAGRGAIADGPVGHALRGASADANQNSIIPEAWIKWASSAQPEMNGRDDAER